MHREDSYREIAALGYCKFLLRKQEVSVLLHRLHRLFFSQETNFGNDKKKISVICVICG